MTLDYTINNKVKISLHKYINKMLTELPTDINGRTKTPAAGHLFSINPEMKKLREATAQIFHHLLAKMLYLLRCTRQDIQTAVHFYAPEYKPPTGNMLADFVTKLLKGTAFLRMHKKVLNLPRSTTVHRSVLRIEDKNNDGNKNIETARNQKYSGPRVPGK